MIIPSQESGKRLLVSNISNENIILFSGVLLRGGDAADLFIEDPMITDARALDDMQNPNGSLYIECSINNRVRIIDFDTEDFIAPNLIYGFSNRVIFRRPSQEVSGGGGSFDGYAHNFPRNRNLYNTGYVALLDDFYGYLNDHNHAWLQDGAGTGNGTATIPGVAGRNGIVRTETGTTATGRASYFTGLTSLALVPGGGIAISYENVFRLDAMPDVTEDYVLVLGLNSTNGAGSHVHGIGILIDRSVNANNFVINSINNNAGPTNVDSGIAVTAGQWYHYKFVINGTGTSSSHYIDGVLIATITTNLPTSTTPFSTGLMPNWRILKSAGTTSRGIDIDFVSIVIDRGSEVVLL